MHLLSAGWLSPIIQIVTILVLGVTCWAAWAQAKAANRLTAATKQQIRTNEEQALAAKQQVEVARRQIVEALRPLLTFKVSGFVYRGVATNEGSGVALDVWWKYGQWGDRRPERNQLDRGLIPPGRELSFTFDAARAQRDGITLVYRSLAGRASATYVSWNQTSVHLTYSEDVTDWENMVIAALAAPVD